MEGLREVDPRGDVIITLRNPGAPFAGAVPEALATRKHKKKKKGKGTLGRWSLSRLVSVTEANPVQK